MRKFNLLYFCILILLCSCKNRYAVIDALCGKLPETREYDSSFIDDLKASAGSSINNKNFNCVEGFKNYKIHSIFHEPVENLKYKPKVKNRVFYRVSKNLSSIFTKNEVFEDNGLYFYKITDIPVGSVGYVYNNKLNISKSLDICL